MTGLWWFNRLPVLVFWGIFVNTDFVTQDTEDGLSFFGDAKVSCPAESFSPEHEEQSVEEKSSKNKADNPVRFFEEPGCFL
jgi:hypothetical protein